MGDVRSEQIHLRSEHRSRALLSLRFQQTLGLYLDKCKAVEWLICCTPHANGDPIFGDSRLTASIPDDVRRFVLTGISSIPMMEAALLFHETPATRRTAVDVASALYLPEKVAAQLLQDLQDLGVVQENQGQFIYAPKDPTLASILDRTARAYRENLILMTQLVHDQTQRNATRFADAFKIRKDR
ncbi:MAG: hypothetical protein ACM3VZ_16385 [Acidobacteriota bacterium]